jgi:hypothetical protein
MRTIHLLTLTLLTQNFSVEATNPQANSQSLNGNIVLVAVPQAGYVQQLKDTEKTIDELKSSIPTVTNPEEKKDLEGQLKFSETMRDELKESIATGQPLNPEVIKEALREAAQESAGSAPIEGSEESAPPVSSEEGSQDVLQRGVGNND